MSVKPNTSRYARSTDQETDRRALQWIREGKADWSLIHADQFSAAQPAAGPVRSDFIDFPTAWRITREGVVHTDRRCSYVSTWGAMLCDCDGLEAEWNRRNGRVS